MGLHTLWEAGVFNSGWKLGFMVGVKMSKNGLYIGESKMIILSRKELERVFGGGFFKSLGSSLQKINEEVDKATRNIREKIDKTVKNITDVVQRDIKDFQAGREEVRQEKQKTDL